MIQSGLYYKKHFWLSKSVVYIQEWFQIKRGLQWCAYGIEFEWIRNLNPNEVWIQMKFAESLPVETLSAKTLPDRT